MKALRQSKKRQERNRMVKETVAYLRKQTRKAFEAKDRKKAEEWVKKTIKALDKAVQNGVLKKNTVSRTKSRLMKKLNDLKGKK